MGVGVNAAQSETSGILAENNENQQSSLKGDVLGTAAFHPGLRVHSGTETYIAQETGDTASPVKLIPESSIHRRQIRGKTLGSWGLDRRRAARELTEMWQEAVSHIDSDGFAVYVEELISKTDEYMPIFRDIPNEDAFSGVLQLIRDAISGQNFERIQSQKLDKPVKEIFSLLRKQNITMSTHQTAFDILYDSGFIQKV